jgi:hypothetical protein
MWIFRRDVDGTGSGLYPVVGFTISIVEIVGFWYSKGDYTVTGDLLSASDGKCTKCLWSHR